MKSRYFLIIIIPGLALFLLLSLRGVRAFTAANTTSFPDSVAASSSDTALVNTEPDITVVKTATPSSLPEPGGQVTFGVTIKNLDSVVVTVTEIDDSSYGNLLDAGNTKVTGNNCPDIIPAIPIDGEVGCSFKANVISNQPGSHINTVMVTVTNGVQPVTKEDSAQVVITDEPSSIQTTLTVNPTSVIEPGGTVAFTVKIKNTSKTDQVTIETLVGTSALGNLDGKGSCSLPKMLAVNAVYQCSFTATVSGAAGQTKTYIVTAAGTDDDGQAVTGDSAPVQVAITKAPIFTMFLPLSFNNFVLSEPNNTCNQAHPIAINTDHYFLADDKDDWYHFNLGSSGNLVVEMTNFVPIRGQIVVYKGSCNNLEKPWNNGNFSSTKIVNVGAVSAGTYHIRVITDGPFNHTDPYKLRVRFP